MSIKIERGGGQRLSRGDFKKGKSYIRNDGSIYMIIEEPYNPDSNQIKIYANDHIEIVKCKNIGYGDYFEIDVVISFN